MTESAAAARKVALFAAATMCCSLVSFTADAQVPREPASRYPVVKPAEFVHGQTSETTIRHDNRDRRVAYYIPRNFDIAKKHPLIFFFHESNTPLDVLVRSNLAVEPRADADGTILVYPVATGNPAERTQYWNALSSPGTLPGSVEKVDDIGFVERLVDVFVKELNADPDRVYAAGSSQGGAMTYALSCHIPDRLAAIAPALMQVTVDIVRKHSTARPLPVMLVTGTADPVVPATGVGGVVSSDGIVSAKENIAYWKARNGASGDPESVALANPVAEVFRAAKAPSHIIRHAWGRGGTNEILWLEVVNGGHVMPDYLDDYEAAVGIYDFLLRHARRH